MVEGRGRVDNCYGLGETVYRAESDGAEEGAKHDEWFGEEEFDRAEE